MSIMHNGAGACCRLSCELHGHTWKGGVCAGFAAQVGSTSPFAGFEGYHCGWGPPAVMPIPRTNDTWGMGWQNLYEVEVMEMKAADLTQACPKTPPTHLQEGSSHDSEIQNRAEAALTLPVLGNRLLGRGLYCALHTGNMVKPCCSHLRAGTRSTRPMGAASEHAVNVRAPLCNLLACHLMALVSMSSCTNDDGG